MYKPEEVQEVLTRANERLKMIEEVEDEIKKLDQLKEKWKELTGEDKI